MDDLPDPHPRRIGLLLSGGGARAAYQVGVLKGIAELVPPRAPSPFKVICGTSAGAINGAALAVYACRYHLAVRRLTRVWENFHVDQVFRADAWGVLANSLRWMLALAAGGLGRHNPHALLNRRPLANLLAEMLDCERIEQVIAAGHLHAFSVTVSGYTSGQSVTFYQGVPEIKPWKRARRVGVPTRITRDHLLASASIPLIFEAVKINREWFGDGSMRQIAPTSSLLHLGADRILVIGARREGDEPPERMKSEGYPSLAQIGGHVLNSIFLDTLETDLERLRRINKTISLIPSHRLIEGGVALRQVDALVISPSRELDAIALRYGHFLPRPVRTLLRGIGALKRNGSNLLSYLLFEEAYCRELIALGRRDALARREELVDFLELNKGTERSQACA